MSGQCTYTEKGVRCTEPGEGQTGPTASHWLCEHHLEELIGAIDNYGYRGGIDNLKRMIGMTVRAGGGAQAMTDKMQPSIEAGARVIEALAKSRSTASGTSKGEGEPKSPANGDNK